MLIKFQYLSVILPTEVPTLFERDRHFKCVAVSLASDIPLKVMFKQHEDSGVILLNQTYIYPFFFKGKCT